MMVITKQGITVVKVAVWKSLYYPMATFIK